MMVVQPNEIITDYRIFAVATIIMIIFAILHGAPSLIFSIPAVITAFKSRRALKEERLRDAKSLSIASAYLSTAALVVGIIVISCVVIIPVFFRIQIKRSIHGV